MILLAFPTEKQQPTLAPPRPVCLFMWQPYYASGVWYYTVGTDQQEARPWEHSWDPFGGVQEGPSYGLEMKRSIPVREFGLRARREARKYESRWCWPGEQDW